MIPKVLRKRSTGLVVFAKTLKNILLKTPVLEHLRGSLNEVTLDIRTYLKLELYEQIQQQSEGYHTSEDEKVCSRHKFMHDVSKLVEISHDLIVL